MSRHPIDHVLRSLGGVVWYGPALHIGGYGNATRAYLRALLRLGHRVRVRDVSLDHSALLDPGALDVVRSAQAAAVGLRPVEIFHTDPRSYATSGVATPAARVGVSVFETMSLPESWRAPLHEMDAVWVPTELHRAIYAQAGVRPERIHVVPFAVDTDFFAPRQTPVNPRFRFVYASVWDQRKAIDVLARAFVDAFPAHEPVELVIQTSIPEMNGDQAQREALARLESAVGRLPAGERRIEVRTRPLSQPELRDLYATADLYISSDRNNIWTLPCIETLAMGRPCASADYARATAWLADDNPLFLRCEDRLADTEPELARLRPLYAGQQWASLRDGELVRAMRWAVSHPQELARLAEEGRRYVLTTHSVDAVAPKLAAALEALDLRRAHLRPRRVVPQLLGVDTTAPAPVRRALLGKVKTFLQR